LRALRIFREAVNERARARASSKFIARVFYIPRILYPLLPGRIRQQVFDKEHRREDADAFDGTSGITRANDEANEEAP